MDIKVIFLPQDVSPYLKNVNDNPLFTHSKKLIIYTSYPKEQTKKCLNMININQGELRTLPKHLKNYDSIHSYIEKDNINRNINTKNMVRKLSKKLKFSDKDIKQMNLMDHLKIMVVTDFDKYIKSKANKITRNYNFRQLKKLINKRRTQKNKKKKQKGGTCKESIEYLVENYNDNNTNTKSLKFYRNFHEVLSKCKLFSNNLIAGFIVLTDCKKNIDECDFNPYQDINDTLKINDL